MNIKALFLVMTLGLYGCDGFNVGWENPPTRPPGTPREDTDQKLSSGFYFSQAVEAEGGVSPLLALLYPDNDSNETTRTLLVYTFNRDLCKPKENVPFKSFGGVSANYRKGGVVVIQKAVDGCTEVSQEVLPDGTGAPFIRVSFKKTGASAFERMDIPYVKTDLATFKTRLIAYNFKDFFDNYNPQSDLQNACEDMFDENCNELLSP